MTTEENQNDKKESKSNAAGDAVGKIMAFKSSNPKVFFGAIGAVVVLLLVVMLSGGNPEVIKERSAVNLQVGKTYKLHNPNAAGEQAMTSLVKEPCVLTGYDRSQNDDLYVCLAPAESEVEILELVDAYGISDHCAKVKVLSGKCQGKEGWTLVNSIK